MALNSFSTSLPVATNDFPKLFMVDGSSFVTGRRNHPACTIGGLAFREAEHMIGLAKIGGLKAPLA